MMIVPFIDRDCLKLYRGLLQPLNSAFIFVDLANLSTNVPIL